MRATNVYTWIPHGNSYQPTRTRKTTTVRGLAIVSIGSCIKRINKLHYKVKSQSSDDGECYYVVKKYGHNLGGRQNGEWIVIRVQELDISSMFVSKGIITTTRWKGSTGK